MPISKKRIELFLLIALIVISAFFRFYKIREYVVFLGDEGRDMIILRDIFVKKHLPFLGPTASVGGFYLGPIYYWMAAPFLLLSMFDPIGPSYMVALFGIATVILLYKFLRETSGFVPAMLMSILYATAPLIVRYSRSSWNPNPLPFFSLALVYLVYCGIKKEKLIYFLAAGACFGVAIQLHYLALVLAPIAFLIVVLNLNYKKIPKVALACVLGAFITFSPFLIFEIRHNFPNFKTILEFVTRGTVSYGQSNILGRYSSGGAQLLNFIASSSNRIAGDVVFLVLFLTGTSLLIGCWKDRSKRLIYSIGFIYFFVGLFFIRAYKGAVYDYYYGSIFPSPFLLSGLITGAFYKNKLFRFSVFLIVFLLLLFFVSKGFYRNQPNNLLLQTETVANLIIEKANNQPYNFALISSSNSDHAYRYFLEIKNHRPTPLEELVTQQLIVVCETKNCEPLGNPLWEVAAFGRGEINGSWDTEYGFKLYRLVHWLGEPSPAGKPAKKGI